MKFLITADIHITDRPRDDYRLGLFSWLHKQQEDHEVDATFILGDLTNDKDRHSSVLVNNMVDRLKLLNPPVFILRGNHDCIDPNTPFFKFLSAVPGVTFCTNFTLINEFKVCMIPHQTSQASLDAAFKRVPEGWLAMCHQTFTGAKSETGTVLTGMALPPNKASAVLSGDIHVPHTISTPNGNITYIGAPYHVRFGDQFRPRAILLTDAKQSDLHYPTAPRKLSLTVRDPSELPSLNKGDQVKVTLELPRSELVEWANHKQAIYDSCKGKGVEVFGVTLKAPPQRKRPQLDSTPSGKKSSIDYFNEFCSREQVPVQMKQAGQLLLGGGDVQDKQSNSN